jgi:transposase
MPSRKEMARKIPMGKKEIRRSQVMAMVVEGTRTLKWAAEQMGVSYRQAIRIKKRYLSEGTEGLIHKNTGKDSPNKIDEEIRKAALDFHREEKRADFGPTLTTEHLESEKGIEVSVETVRQWLMGDGQWTRKRKRMQHRDRRERKEKFGELVQMDGSEHDWFEGRGPKCCLMNMVDDAQGTTYARSFPQETIEAAMRVLEGWIGHYGVPEALYTDRKNVYVLDREPTNAELLEGITKPKSHFEKACDKLGIQVIAAHSPQAKGRVERNHGIYQDRLVKEMRLRGISSIEDANKFLDEEYLKAINEKFEKEAASSEDAHVPLLDADLRNILVVEHTRTVSRDWVVQYNGHLYQILGENRNRPQPGKKVTLRFRLDGSMDIYWKGKPLLVKELELPTKKEAAVSTRGKRHKVA